MHFILNMWPTIGCTFDFVHVFQITMFGTFTICKCIIMYVSFKQGKSPNDMKVLLFQLGQKGYN